MSWVDIAKDIKEFLMTRRARLRPEEFGLSAGRRRRVPGLRREEVAQLAGVSSEYYTKIERGNVAGVSDEVLHAVARALRLTDDETAHFFNLARAAVATRGVTRARRSSQPTMPDGMQALMDSMLDAPAIVMTGGLDVLAANPLGRALYAPVFDRATGTPNLARFVFFDPPPSSSSPSGKRQPTRRSDCFRPRPHALRIRLPSRRSSVNWQLAAMNSAPAGLLTMSPHTGTAPSDSATGQSVNSR